jgi:hypothetical protein
MEHFSEQTWGDFVRGISNPETRKGVESHLASGCSDCAAAFDTWKRVYAIAANENTCTPPDNIVRAVKQEFVAKYPQQPSRWVLATLVFDTITQPLPAGVRGGAVTARQLIFEAEGLTVDLRLDAEPQSNTICAVGQVLDKGIPRSPANASIMLWTEKGEPVVETQANQFGEFQLEFEAQDQLRLSIEMAGRRPVRIPLVNLKPNQEPPITKGTEAGY